MTELLAFFTAPANYAITASTAQWTEFLQQARQQGMTGRFYYLIQRLNLLDVVPQQVIEHGLSGAVYAQKQQHMLFYELSLLEPLVESLPFPCLLLKGAAYRAKALPVSYGRLFSDIDLLVPADKLKLVRDKLFFLGFQEIKLNAYDRDYYLNWSHQNPPLVHYQRGTVIDLHHHIYPSASAKKINIAPLFDHADSMAGSDIKVPCKPHLFIHAAVHLFYQEETHKLVKDLIDLNDLLAELSTDSDLSALHHQSALMSVQNAVSDACQVLVLLFDNKQATKYLQHASYPRRSFACFLILKMLKGNKLSSWLAHQIWYVRGHILKMRWQVLLYHSTAKPIHAVRRWLSGKA